MQIEENTEDGLYYRSWKSNEPKAAIILIHGLGEHCQRYEHVAQALTEKGYSLYAMDLPGHGKSTGVRGHIDSFEVFTDAALNLLKRVGQEKPELPKFILGHSMGGLIVSRFLLDHQDKVSGAMLSGPAIQSPQEPPAWQVGLIKTIAKFIPTAKMLALDASEVSRDPKVVEKYMNDPLISKEKLSARFLVEMTNTMEDVKTKANEISLPILIMHGSKDSMTSPSGSELLFNTCGSSVKTLELYDGLYHEILNEPEQNTVINDILSWLKGQTS